MTHLKPGDPAPEFTLLDHESNPVSLSDFAGQKVVVYFYPAALTKGCTIEAVDFTSVLDEMQSCGYQIIGISPDPVEKIDRFITKENIRHILLSDPAKETIAAYGAWGERTIFGSTVVGVLRSTFVIDVKTDGPATIEMAKYSVRATGHVARLMKDLGIDEP